MAHVPATMPQKTQIVHSSFPSTAHPHHWRRTSPQYNTGMQHAQRRNTHAQLWYISLQNMHDIAMPASTYRPLSTQRTILPSALNVHLNYATHQTRCTKHDNHHSVCVHVQFHRYRQCSSICMYLAVVPKQTFKSNLSHSKMWLATYHLYQSTT
jgi:hypothetical protein